MNGKAELRFFMLALIGLLVNMSHAAAPTSVVQLSENNTDMRRLHIQSDAQPQPGANQPHTLYLGNQHLKQAPYAEYIRAVRDKLNRIAIEHYTRLGLGSLKRQINTSVAITIKYDGSVQQAKLLTPPGDPAVDKAVLSIVNLASPFIPFSDALREKADVVVITNHWYFAPAPESPAE